MRYTILAGLIAVGLLEGQSVQVRKATSVEMPILVDSNSPAYWHDSQFHLVNSSGVALVTSGSSQFYLDGADSSVVEILPGDNGPYWIEAVWQDADGLLFAWYHTEPGGVCPGTSLTWPMIGALVSEDAGLTYYDMGIILSAAEAPDCSARNGYFSGGHGDFSVIEDNGYFYFLFGNYGGDVAGQGVAMARMEIRHALNPVGAVEKYYEGGWTEPGLGGQVTPVFPAKAPWQAQNTDSFWGPSVHFNTHLNSYVVLMSRSCCGPRWPQEGIYVAFNPDLSNPEGWSAPKRIMSAADIGFTPGWYPQVLGIDPGETDTLAGQAARLYIKGISKWELIFEP